jgi:hypothetical protein
LEIQDTKTLDLLERLGKIREYYQYEDRATTGTKIIDKLDEMTLNILNSIAPETK